MKLTNSARRARGSALIELAAMGFVLPVVAIMAFNVGVLVYAAWVNDAACRDACRSASQQGNQADAIVAAVSAAKQYSTAGGIFGNPKVILDKNFKFEPYYDKDGKPQIEKGPFVTITTKLNSKLPCPIIYTGKGFSDFVVFEQSYTFPIMNPNQLEKSTPQFDQTLAHQEDDQLQKGIDDAKAAAAAAAQAAGSVASGTGPSDGPA